jgi:hypothetical protein
LLPGPCTSRITLRGRFSGRGARSTPPAGAADQGSVAVVVVAVVVVVGVVGVVGVVVAVVGVVVAVVGVVAVAVVGGVGVERAKTGSGSVGGVTDRTSTMMGWRGGGVCCVHDVKAGISAGRRDTSPSRATKKTAACRATAARAATRCRLPFKVERRHMAEGTVASVEAVVGCHEPGSACRRVSASLVSAGPNAAAGTTLTHLAAGH